MNAEANDFARFVEARGGTAADGLATDGRLGPGRGPGADGTGAGLAALGTHQAAG